MLWLLEGLYSVNRDLLGYIGSRDKKDISFFKENYDRLTDRPTNRQTDMRAHREVTLPIIRI